MEFELPEVPVFVLGLLGFLAPYVTGVLNGVIFPRRQLSVGARRAFSVVVSIVLAAIVLFVYYLESGDPIPGWYALALITIVTSQTSYSLITKGTAKALEDKTALVTANALSKRDNNSADHSINPSENEHGPSMEDVGATFVDAEDTLDDPVATDPDLEDVPTASEEVDVPEEPIPDAEYETRRERRENEG